MKQILAMFYFSIAFYIFNINNINAKFDATVVGPVKFADGLARVAISFIDSVKPKLNINFIPTGPVDFQDLPGSIYSIINNPDKTPGKVALFFDLPWNVWTTNAEYVPDSPIKIAYSMFEATQVPKEWVNIFNNKFDALVVPDEYLVNIYKKSGVNIPVFIIPIGLYLKDFLSKPVKQRKNKLFTFGVSAGFWPRKNYELLVDAFTEAFGNNKNVRLIIHGRMAAAGCYEQLLIKIKSQNIKNIILIKSSFTQKQYIRFLRSLDCYVLLSKGEGFSITPREALALGIPCILSNNTAHKTICDTGFIESVSAGISEPLFDPGLGGFCGNVYNCKKEDACNSLKKVYYNYDKYRLLAHKSRKWVEQYLFNNLADYYITLIKPEKIVLGENNIIKPGILTTNSRALFNKYKS